MNINKTTGMIEIDCRKCTNVKNDACILYGNNAKLAVEKCAKDLFIAYNQKQEEGEADDE